MVPFFGGKGEGNTLKAKRSRRVFSNSSKPFTEVGIVKISISLATYTPR
jgi:hypothetical protein